MPLDAPMSARCGSCLRARVLKHGDNVAEWEKRGTSHWATCPHAEEHRKPKRTRMDRRG